MRQETRPWGRFEVIYETEHTWLKRIIIAPGQSLSYQYHANRIEHWMPETTGAWAEIDDRTFELTKGFMAPYTIYPLQKHRLFNPCADEVSVLEWVTGFPDEEDIVRVSDLYGR